MPDPQPDHDFVQQALSRSIERALDVANGASTSASRAEADARIALSLIEQHMAECNRAQAAAHEERAAARRDVKDGFAGLTEGVRRLHNRIDEVRAERNSLVLRVLTWALGGMGSLAITLLAAIWYFLVHGFPWHAAGGG